MRIVHGNPRQSMIMYGLHGNVNQDMVVALLSKVDQLLPLFFSAATFPKVSTI
jgi:hypothetical protein